MTNADSLLIGFNLLFLVGLPLFLACWLVELAIDYRNKWKGKP